MAFWNWHRQPRGAQAEAAAEGAAPDTLTPERGVGSEAPIRPASEDRLRRSCFAERLATVLSEPSVEEGRVFALRGGWGFGKSSLKNLVAEQLQQRPDGAMWVDFNPWRWGDGDAISKALFDEIANRLGGEDSDEAKERAKALRRYGAMINGNAAPLKHASGVDRVLTTVLTNASVIGLASAYGFALPGVAIASGILALLATALAIVGKILSFLGRDRSAGSLEALRKNLEKRLRTLDRPLVVFVDDIDRLDPEQIRLIFRLVKANANLPNITFVLLYQMSIVERALDPIANNMGRAYLEKIVQAAFDLPAVSPGIAHSNFVVELTEIAGRHATESNGFSERRWGNVLIGCIQPMLRNMRDSRRLCSSIAVHLPLHGAEDAFEVNIIDVLLLETLRVFEPALHEALFHRRELVLQEQRWGRHEQQEEDRIAATKLLELVTPERQEAVKSSLKELFPGIEWAFGGMNYADGFHEQWMTDKRVCTTRYFPRYFELQDAVGELSERVFVGFLEATADAQELDNAVSAFREQGLLGALVTRLDESVARLPVQNAAIVLPALYRIAEEFAGADAPDPFKSPWLSAWRATSWYLKSVPEADRGALALAALSETGALSVVAMLITLSDPENRKDKDAGFYEPPIDEASLQTLKDEWLRIIQEHAKDEANMLAGRDLISQLYHWRDFSGSFDEPKAWASRAIRKDEGFVVFVTRMMSRGTSYGEGDKAAVVELHFNRNTVETFIGVEAAKARLDVLDRSQFLEHEKSLQAFDRYLSGWLGLSNENLFGE
jgi:hypothetical protein